MRVPGVREWMSTDVQVVKPHTSVAEAESLMERCSIRRLPAA